MAKSLLVVESPTKVKTLSKFLGKNFTIKATYGHIKDLPKSKMGVDPEEGFKPHFTQIKGKSKVIDALKKAGVITGAQKGAIQSCAAQSSIGK